MRGYTNAAGGGTLASIAFDREAFAEYLEQLGSINDVRDRLQDFLDSVAYSFTSGTITADKFVTAGNNLLPRLDSFEDEQGRSIPMFPDLGIINAAIPVIASDPYYPAPHGATVLKITTPVAVGPFTFYLNPYNNNDSTWFKLGKMDYWFSYYLYTTSPLAVTGSIDLLNTTNAIISSVAFSITEAQGWLRFSNNFTLAINSDVKFRITINEGGQNLYLDAVQVEYKYITTPVPTNFAPGGKVVIEGGNIRANSISASDAIFQDAAIIDANIANINAAKIDAGIVNTNVVTVGDYDRGLMTMFDNNLSFYEPIDALTQMKRVSIGKLDPLGTNWGLEVRGTDGTTVLFDHTGLTSLGTTDGLTKAAYIDENLDIYGSKLRDGSVEGSIKIAANSIVSDNIAAGAITTDTLAANAVTAEKITAETINASHLNSNIVTSKLIQLGETTVTAGIYGGGTTDSNIRFWAGDTFANRETAPFRVTQDGKLYATGANIIVGYATNTELNNSINSVLADAQAYADILSEDLQSQLDGNITTWFYPVEPTLVNAPAVDWITDELKNIHLGDLYYDTVTGYSYRFALISTVYQWIRITDVDVTKALSDAANAQDTADSKRRVFSTQPTPPYDTGDLWSQGFSGDLMLCVVSRQTGIYSASDWAKASKYTDDTTAINNLAAAKLYADGKAAEAQAAAEAVAVAEASLAQSQANAYADGIVSNEEQARINQDQAVLDAAKQDALAKAQAAEAAAKTYTDSQLNDFGITINNSLGDLQDQIDGSMTTWYYKVAPTNTNPPAIDWTTTELKDNHLGDLYYDTVTGYAYRWQLDTGIYSWQRLLDIDVVQALSDAASAQDTADSKRRVFTSEPTTPYEIGDLWVQGVSGDIMNCTVVRTTGLYNASDWVKASKYTDDTTAINNLAAAKLYADGKAAEAQAAAEAVAISQAALAQSQASAYADGIVSDEEQARINQDQAVLDAAKADALLKAQNAEAAAKTYTDAQLNDFSTAINNSLGDLQNQIDGSVTTWFYNVEPTTTNAPAIDWNAVELKNKHLGDLYYNTITGYAYRWQVTSGVYSWKKITDIDVTQALADASLAQDTADSKRRVFVSQPVPPYDIGDLWVQGTSGDIMNCILARATGTYSTTDWVKASKYTDDAVALAAAQAASDAQDSADAANLLLADLSRDDRLTAVEKQSTKKEWDVIVAEKAGLEAQADLFSITTEKTSYTNSYNTLNSYITPLLADLTTTSTIVGTTFRTNFKNYYNARTVLLNKIASVSKSLIDTKAPTVITSTTTPTLPVIGQQWVDLNLTPPMMKVWNGTAWVFTNYTASEFDVKVGSISLAVAEAEIAESVTPILTDYGTRISSAETKITPTAITNTVRTSTDYINDLGTKYNQTAGSTLEQTVSGLTLTVGDYENGVLTGTKYTFDGTGATFLGGGLKIKNNAGTDVFYADVNGNLTFSGALSGATGTFSGALSAATGTFSGSLSAATGSFSGSVTATSGKVGNWTIGTNTITSSNGKMKLDSANNRIYINTTDYLYANSTDGDRITFSGGISIAGSLNMGQNPASASQYTANSTTGGTFTVYKPNDIENRVGSGLADLKVNGNTILTTASTSDQYTRGPIKMWVPADTSTLYIEQ